MWLRSQGAAGGRYRTAGLGGMGRSPHARAVATWSSDRGAGWSATGAGPAASVFSFAHRTCRSTVVAETARREAVLVVGTPMASRGRPAREGVGRVGAAGRRAQPIGRSARRRAALLRGPVMAGVHPRRGARAALGARSPRGLSSPGPECPRPGAAPLCSEAGRRRAPRSGTDGGRTPSTCPSAPLSAPSTSGPRGSAAW